MTVEQFWCQVFGRSTESVGLVGIFHVELAETEVTQRNVTGVVEKNVFRFQIAVIKKEKSDGVMAPDAYGNAPVDDVELMKMLEGEKEFSAVEATALFVEPLLALQVVEKLSAIDEPVYTVSSMWVGHK